MSKPIDLPGVGVIVPTSQMVKKAVLNKDNLEKFNEKDLSELILVLNRKFIDETGVFIRNKDSS